MVAFSHTFTLTKKQMSELCGEVEALIYKKFNAGADIGDIDAMNDILNSYTFRYESARQGFSMCPGYAFENIPFLLDEEIADD